MASKATRAKKINVMSKANAKILLKNIKWSLTHEETDVDFIFATADMALEELEQEGEVYQLYHKENG